MSHSWSHIEPPPDPPTARSTVVFLVFGVTHLVLAATIESLRTLNLVLGLVHLLLAAYFFQANATWKKGRAEWWEQLRGRIAPGSGPPSTHHH